jgi:hypothetical protein
VFGLLAGAGMGLYGLINPKWAANLVRLRDDPEKAGGFAEFRATYGGLFLAGHAVALWYLVDLLRLRPTFDVAGIMGVAEHAMAFGALTVCGALWIGTGLARGVSMLLDGTGTKFNQGSALFELALGLAILAPRLIH